MITNLDDMLAYCRKKCVSKPTLASRCDLSSGLCSPEELKSIRKSLPELPTSYLDTLSRVGVLGKSIGYFSLWPSAFGKVDLFSSLKEANSDRNPLFNELEKIGLMEVASFEAEPISVVKSGKLNEGAIIKLDIANPIMPQITLADSFEQFLLIAGSLDQVRAAGEGAEVIETFIGEVVALTCHDIAESWRIICEIVLGC